MGLNVKTPTVNAVLKGMVVGGKGYGISHSWNGSVLTVTSDSGTSSADLLGPVGPAGEGAEMFVAQLNLENGKYTADKTFAEVKEHIAAGELVVCDFVGADSKTRCPLTTYTEYSATFVLQSLFGTDEYFILTDDGVTHMAAEKEKKLVSVASVKNGTSLTVTAKYDDGSSSVTQITLDEDDVPLTVARGFQSVALTWEGFDA